MEVSRTARIGALITAYPHIVPVLREAGVHCVGCGVSEIETLEEGLRHHGRSEVEIDAIVERLANAAANPSSVREDAHDGITITIEAALRFGEVIRERGRLGCALRISTYGPEAAYRFEIDDTKRHDDQVLTIAGTRFYIDSDSRGSLRGITIDHANGAFSIMRP